MRFTNREDATRLVAERLAPMTNAVKDQLEPALEQVEENMKDLIEGTARQVKRSPVRAMSAAVVGGMFAGCLIGFAAGRCARR